MSSAPPSASGPAPVALPSPVTLAALAARYGGVVTKEAGALEVTAIAPVRVAVAGQLAPLLAARRGYVNAAVLGDAAILVEESIADRVPAARRWSHPRASFALASILRSITPPAAPDARHAAHVHPQAEVHATASIGPGAVILAGATVGPAARVEPNAVVYGGSVIGARAVIGAGAVIGRPGFGWTFDEAGQVFRVPQLGGVRIEDDAEVGPLCTIDAGTLSPTVIARGAKLDAHVHVGHNAVVGPGAMVAAQAGFAGSSEIGRGVLVGGQAGVGDHVKVGDGARIGGGAGVIGDIEAGATVAGYPAIARARWLRLMAEALRTGAPGPRRKRRPT